MKLLAAALVSAAMALLTVRSAWPLNPCVTTDPVVVLGNQVLPSMTECVPPQ